MGKKERNAQKKKGRGRDDEEKNGIGKKKKPMQTWCQKIALLSGGEEKIINREGKKGEGRGRGGGSFKGGGERYTSAQPSEKAHNSMQLPHLSTTQREGAC